MTFPFSKENCPKRVAAVQYAYGSPEYWRDHAARARRLASEIVTKESADRLNKVAEEFDAQAAILGAERAGKSK